LNGPALPEMGGTAGKGAPWRAALRPAEATVRFETGAGEQGQVDWGSTWIYLGPERVRGAAAPKVRQTSCGAVRHLALLAPAHLHMAITPLFRP